MTRTRLPQILVLLALPLLNCAVACAGSAGQEDPKTAYDHYLTGNVLCSSGQNDQAIAALRESVRLDPDYYYARVNLGVALAKSQKLTEAIETFTLCIDKRWGSQTDRFVFCLNRAIANDEAKAEKLAQADRAILAKLDAVRAAEVANSRDYVFMDAAYCERRNQTDRDRLFDKHKTSLAKGQIIVQKIAHAGKNAEEYEALGTIEGTLEEAAAVLMDFQSYPQFMPNVSEIKIVSSTQDATVVDYKLLLPLGVVKKYRLKFWSKKEEHKIQLFWKKLPWPGLKPDETVIDTYGQWILEKSPQKDGHVPAYYRVYTDPGNIPFGMGWIVDALTQNSIPDIIESTANRVKGGNSSAAPQTDSRKHSAVTILKTDPDTPSGRPGSGFRITYRWQAAPLDKDLTAFVQIVDKEGKVVLQDDHKPPTPTSQWNGLVAYTRTVPLEQWQVKDKGTIDIALAEGRYAIYAGLYDQKQGQKAPLRAGQGVRQIDEGRYQIGVLTIDARAPIPGPGERTLDLTGYHVTFNEEFDDLSVSAWGPAGEAGTRWIAHTPWHGDFGDARFSDPEPDFPFTVKDGVLRIEARKQGGRWASGLLSAVDPNGNGFKQEYGYFECRAKFPKGPGTWPAFWLMGLKSLKGVPGNTGPRVNPEVDVVEHYGHWPWKFHYALHQWGRSGAASKHDEKRFVVFGTEEDFHSYGVMIDEQHIILCFDGVELHREKTPESVKTPLFPLVNLALGPGWPTDKTPDPSYMYVDYVKIWQKRAN